MRLKTFTLYDEFWKVYIYRPYRSITGRQLHRLGRIKEKALNFKTRESAKNYILRLFDEEEYDDLIVVGAALREDIIILEENALWLK